jgi:hypothetical protein
VGVDIEHRGEVLGRRQPLAGAGLAVGDGAPEFAGDLLVQGGRLRGIDLDTENDATDINFIRLRWPGA